MKRLSFKKFLELTEAGGGADVTGMYAPTNGLLSPEEDPFFTYGKVKTIFADTDDEFIDKNKLDNIAKDVVPGDGVEYPQRDGKNGFDARDIAARIIRNTSGKSAISKKRR